jgi:hypothetical protein
MRRASHSLGVNQEDVMNFSRTAVSAAVLCLALCASGTIAAEASAPANIKDCLVMSKKVKEALNTAQQSPNYDAARAQNEAGRDYCMQGLYRYGVDRYAQALKLLGAS